MASIPVHGSPQPPDFLLDPGKIGFGRYFSPHIFLLDYHRDSGWQNPRIEKLDDFRLHPATMALHYGQTIFEGMKAFLHEDGSLHLFRPRDHAARLNRSARRLVIPEIDPEQAVEAMATLVALDRDWAPPCPGALYLRPTVIATDPFLGVRPSESYLFYIILSPVGSYIQGALQGIRARTETKLSRTGPGGTGEVKSGGNYASSLLAGRQAQADGFQQVIWLDAVEHRHLEEMGAMNLMWVEDGVLCTSPLTGTILPGITRNSISVVAPAAGIPFEERMMDVDEFCARIDSGKVSEVMGAGTAAVITPVASVTHKEREHRVGDGQPGPVAMKLYKELTDIQYGRREDSYGWLMKVV